MIEANGYTFRTLQEPIYVNNRVVKQAWMNGIMVYPIGNYAKIKYYINKTYTHSHDYAFGDQGQVYRRGYCGPCTVSVTVKGVAVQILKRPSGYPDKTIKSISLSWNGGGHLGANSGGSSNAVLCCPVTGSETINGFEVRTVQAEMTKIKFRVSSIPICGPLEQPIPLHGYGGYRVVGYDRDSKASNLQYYEALMPNYNNRSYYRHIIEPGIQSGPGFMTFNDRVFAYNRSGNYESGEYVIYDYGDSYVAVDGSMISSSDSNSLRTVPHVRIQCNPGAAGLYIQGMNFLVPVNIKRLDGVWRGSLGTEEVTDLGTKYTPASISFHIDPAEIIYSGDEADAPPEAKTISSADLNLD